MKTKFYLGNYSLRLGRPIVLISTDESDNQYYAEKIIIFESTKEPIFIANSVRYPKIENQTLDDFIQQELEISKDDIMHKIIQVNFEEEIKSLNYDYQIELNETDSKLIGLIKHRLPDFLEKIINTTNDTELMKLVSFYKYLRITRTDFD